MSRGDCLRTLGVSPDASWDAIRQAYKDLVRVWHPDRFQADPQLQHRAEEQLRRVNEAYFALKNPAAFEAGPPDPPPQPKPGGPDPAVGARPQPRGGPEHFASHRLFRWPAKATWIVFICAAPVFLGVLVVNALRVPTLDAVLQNGQPGSGLMGPSRIAGPSGDGFATASELSNWARGQARDLWTSLPKIGDGSAAVAAPATNRVAPEAAAPRAPGTPANGTELRRGGIAGGSQLWVLNQGSQDAIARLLAADTASAVREIYIQARSKVCIRHIAPGVYTLVAETGDSWDPARARFQSGRHTIGKNGPFQCIDMTVGHVTSGQCIDINSTDGASRPANSIVLGSR